MLASGKKVLVFLVGCGWLWITLIKWWGSACILDGGGHVGRGRIFETMCP